GRAVRFRRQLDARRPLAMTESWTAAAEVVALRRADMVARRILELAAPLRVDVARREADREAIYRLRFEVACEMGWIAAEEAPDGLEKDAYDHDAAHVGAWDGGLLVATQRIVFPAPGRRLPLERAFGLEVEPRGQVVQADRTA